MSAIGRIIASVWFPVVGLIRTVAAIVIIMIGVDLTMFEKIDISSMAIPDEYLPWMLGAAIIFGFLGTRGASLYWYRKNANYKGGEKENKWYLFSTIVSLVLGIAVGMFGAGPVANALFIGAGMWTYAAMAGILAAVAGIIVDYCFRFGIREFLIKAPQVAKDYKAAITQSVSEMKDVINVTDIKEKE